MSEYEGRHPEQDVYWVDIAPHIPTAEGGLPVCVAAVNCEVASTAQTSTAQPIHPAIPPFTSQVLALEESSSRGRE